MVAITPKLKGRAFWVLVAAITVVAFVGIGIWRLAACVCD